MSIVRRYHAPVAIVAVLRFSGTATAKAIWDSGETTRTYCSR
jgi:hypothetical protein